MARLRVTLLYRAAVLTFSFAVTTGLSDEVPGSKTVNSVLRPRDFGAKGDGVTDDTEALRRLFSSLSPRHQAVVIDLGSGVYRVSDAETVSDFPAASLTIGAKTSELPQKIKITGSGAKIVMNQKSPAHILLVVCALDTFECTGVTFEREEQTLPGDEYSGGGGIYLTDATPTHAVSLVRFDECKFINCHRAITATTRFADLTTSDLSSPNYVSSGRMKSLQVHNCKFLYPYGSNSSDLSGGGQAFYSGPWTELTEISSCDFDGASNGVANVPNKLPKDGFIFGEPLSLAARKNRLKNFWIEGIASGFQRGSILSRNAFPMPEPGQDVQIVVEQSPSTTALVPGHMLFKPEAGLFEVVSVQNEESIVLRNSGNPFNAKPRAQIPAGRFLLPIKSTGAVICEANQIAGLPVPGFQNSVRAQGTANPAIRVDNMSARLAENFLLGAKGIILTAPETSDPSFRIDYTSILERNFVVLLDANNQFEGLAVAPAVGVSIYQPGVTSNDNIILLTNDQNAIGYQIVVANPKVAIEKDQIRSLCSSEPIKGASRSVGIDIGNIGRPTPEAGISVQRTTFSGLGVGILTRTASVTMHESNAFSGVITPFKSTAGGQGVISP